MVADIERTSPIGAVYTVTQVARLLHKGKEAVYGLLERKELAGRWTGQGGWRISASALETYLRGQDAAVALDAERLTALERRLAAVEAHLERQHPFQRDAFEQLEPGLTDSVEHERRSRRRVSRS